MGGVSVTLLLGTAVIFFYMIIAMFFLTMTTVIMTYIFENIALMKISKNLGYQQCGMAWMPFYNKYILGKIAQNKVLGILLAIDDFLIFIISICYFTMNYPITVFYVILFFVIISLIFNIILTHKVYERMFEKRKDVYTVLSVLTFGFLRPIFLFTVRNKKEKKVEEIQ